ncbi:hypothetical protein FACS189473_1490 [Spirochaetia bacterium]|nr:hypothetical protein FACS189473_1490 [Spirochaetia bacterium]
MGGMGSTNTVMTYPGKVAAITTGPGSAADRYNGDGTVNTVKMQALLDTPIWLVSTYRDNTGMDYDSGILFQDLKDRGGNVRWTHFPANTRSNGGYPDTDIVYGGVGWAHSAYEPMTSNRIKTDDQYNVASVNIHEIDNYNQKGEVSGQRQGFYPGDITYGRTAAGDVPGETLLTWMFKQTATTGF